MVLNRSLPTQTILCNKAVVSPKALTQGVKIAGQERTGKQRITEAAGRSSSGDGVRQHVRMIKIFLPL